MGHKKVNLKKYNTFGLSVQANAFYRVRSVRGLVNILKNNDLPVFILGGGSNILLTKDVDALLLKNELYGKSIIGRAGDTVKIGVRSGENWHRFVLWCIENDLAGVENLSLIPGTVGAAPIQNIGAYGTELKDVFAGLEALELATGNIRFFGKEECNFGYRDSIFKRDLKGKFFITKVFFNLKDAAAADINADYGAVKSVLARRGISSPGIRDISEAVIEIRQSKLPDPKQLGNSGSFFKNPVIDANYFHKIKEKFPDMVHYDLPDGSVKVPAGWLIEHAGWKGKRIGNTGSHAKQALVLVNYGDATGQEIKDLSDAIIASVREKYGIELEREVNVW